MLTLAHRVGDRGRRHAQVVGLLRDAVAERAPARARPARRAGGRCPARRRGREPMYLLLVEAGARRTSRPTSRPRRWRWSPGSTPTRRWTGRPPRWPLVEWRRVIAVVAQARMTSTRLPGKVLRPLDGERPTLQFLVERVQHCERADALVVATSDDPTDDPVAELCERLEVTVHRGPLQDVAGRYLAGRGPLRARRLRARHRRQPADRPAPDRPRHRALPAREAPTSSRTSSRARSRPATRSRWSTPARSAAPTPRCPSRRTSST